MLYLNDKCSIAWTDNSVNISYIQFSKKNNFCLTTGKNSD
jgi:hypothetical protein